MASDASALSGVKLKKVSAADQKVSVASTDLKKMMADAKASKEAAESCNVEKWVDGLEGEVIPVHLIPITPDAARAIVKSYEAVKIPNKPPLNERERQTLSDLASKIDAAAAKAFPNFPKSGEAVSGGGGADSKSSGSGGSGGRGESSFRGFFVRLSTRSPKDAMILHPKMRAAVHNDLVAASASAAAAAALNAKSTDNKSSAPTTLPPPPPPPPATATAATTATASSGGSGGGVETAIEAATRAAAVCAGFPELDDNTKLGSVYVNQIRVLPVQSGSDAVQLLCSSLRCWQGTCHVPRATVHTTRG